MSSIMEFYPEMFLSKWHLLVVFIIVITIIGVKIGGYDKEIMKRYIWKSLIYSYIAVTVIVTFFTYDTKHMDSQMIAWMDDAHEEGKEEDPGLLELDKDLVAYVGSFGDEEEDKTVKVYAGNYRDDQSFHGSVTVFIFDDAGDVIKEESYEDITLEAGDKVEIDTFEVEDEKKPDKFNYLFQEE